MICKYPGTGNPQWVAEQIPRVARDTANDIVKLKSAKIINGGKGIFLAPPDSGRIKTEDGKEQYRYVYEFASTSVKSAATAAAKQAYSRMQDQNERVSYAKFKTKEV